MVTVLDLKNTAKFLYRMPQKFRPIFKMAQVFLDIQYQQVSENLIKYIEYPVQYVRIQDFFYILSNIILWKLEKTFWTHIVCPRSSDPIYILCVQKVVTHFMGHYFLDIWYLRRRLGYRSNQLETVFSTSYGVGGVRLTLTITNLEILLLYVQKVLSILICNKNWKILFGHTVMPFLVIFSAGLSRKNPPKNLGKKIT